MESMNPGQDKRVDRRTFLKGGLIAGAGLAGAGLAIAELTDKTGGS